MAPHPKAVHMTAKLAQRGDLGVDLVEPRAYGPHESLPSRRRHNAARGAGEEANILNYGWRFRASLPTIS